ncbi:hypothetical protein ACWIT3_07850 [Pasteurella sp. P03HT]
MKYPKKLTILISVENENQDYFFSRMRDAGFIENLTDRDLFADESLCRECFNYDSIDKLRALEVLRKDLLKDLQCQISNCIDEFIERLES